MHRHRSYIDAAEYVNAGVIRLPQYQQEPALHFWRPEARSQWVRGRTEILKGVEPFQRALERLVERLNSMQAFPPIVSFLEGSKTPLKKVIQSNTVSPTMMILR